MERKRDIQRQKEGERKREGGRVCVTGTEVVLPSGQKHEST